MEDKKLLASIDENQPHSPRSLDDKKLPSPPSVEEDIALDNKKKMDIGADKSLEASNIMIVEEKDLPLLSQPSIPTPIEIIQDEGDNENIVASPVELKAEEEPEKGILAKAKNWFGINNKSDHVDDGTIKVPPAALNVTEEDDLDDVPAFLPEPVDISASVEKLESLNINRPELQEGFSVPENSSEITEELDDIAAANDAVSPSVVLPNEVKENVKAVSESLDIEAPINLTALDSKASVTADKILENEKFDGLLSLNFLPSQSDIPFDDVSKIKDVVNTIKNDERKRLKIKSYASPIDDRSGSARRISLQRAIAIRSIMVENGIEGVRINVQAMGNTANSGAKDRADILVIED